MGEESIPGRMGEDMMENTSLIRSMAMEFINGQMEEVRIIKKIHFIDRV